MRLLSGALLLVAALGVAGCQKRPATPPQPSNQTAVLGSYGPGSAGAPEPPLSDARGQPIPWPKVPAGTRAEVVRSGDDSALAVWVQDGHVVADSYDRTHGWGTPQPLEQIYGEATGAQLASNGHGVAMALWRHTVGDIESLRYSRYEAATGWSTPDVLPGAVPRPHGAGSNDAPQLQMDAQGNATAQWPSALGAGEVQVARYDATQGWERPVSERLASASPASPAPPASSSVR